ncbi:MAG: hypothetical protein NTV34_15860, partial [Proteobacteria bacterium]|nr:hypothetical protein [Pseudomonadota bacterium]
MKQLRRRTSLATMVSALAFTGCGVPPNHKAPPTSEQQVEVKPTVVRQNPVANEVISGASGQIRVLGGRTLLSELASGKFRAPLTKSMQTEHAAVSSTTPGAAAVSVAEDSLYIQLSKQLLGHGHLFGGVITTVSDQKNETLGRLKLTDLPAINVRPYVAAVEGSKDQFAVALVGCITKCTESSAQAVAIALPILGQTGDGKQLVVDIAKFGESLDLMSILDPDGEYSGLKTIGTRTTAVDMTDATIVWDVEHSMIPKDATSKAEAPVTIIGARYYLMLESALNSAFLSRKQIEGVGFFATSSRQEEVITRFSQTEFNQKPIHYFIKN